MKSKNCDKSSSLVRMSKVSPQLLPCYAEQSLSLTGSTGTSKAVPDGVGCGKDYKLQFRVWKRELVKLQNTLVRWRKGSICVPPKCNSSQGRAQRTWQCRAAVVLRQELKPLVSRWCNCGIFFSSPQDFCKEFSFCSGADNFCNANSLKGLAFIF